LERHADGLERRRARRAHSTAKQFSGHASLKSLEGYIELDELRHNHPLKDIL
jgi:hypothetical protein